MDCADRYTVKVINIEMCGKMLSSLRSLIFESTRTEFHGPHLFVHLLWPLMCWIVHKLIPAVWCKFTKLRRVHWTLTLDMKHHTGWIVIALCEITSDVRGNRLRTIYGRVPSDSRPIFTQRTFLIEKKSYIMGFHVYLIAPRLSRKKMFKLPTPQCKFSATTRKSNDINQLSVVRLVHIGI